MAHEALTGQGKSVRILEKGGNHLLAEPLSQAGNCRRTDEVRRRNFRLDPLLEPRTYL